MHILVNIFRTYAHPLHLVLSAHLQLLQRDYTENVKFSHLSILAPGLLIRNRRATARRWTRLPIISAANELLDHRRFAPRAIYRTSRAHRLSHPTNSLPPFRRLLSHTRPRGLPFHLRIPCSLGGITTGSDPSECSVHVTLRSCAPTRPIRSLQDVGKHPTTRSPCVPHSKRFGDRGFDLQSTYQERRVATAAKVTMQHP